MQLLAFKMEGTTCQGMFLSGLDLLRVLPGSWSENWGYQYCSHKELNSANYLSKLEGKLFHR